MLDRYLKATGQGAEFEPLTGRSRRSATPASSASSPACGSATASPITQRFQPRMWGLLERDLAHPALAPVRAWFDANVPAGKRAAAWATEASA